MSDIDEIKSRLNIVDLVGARVTLKKAGRHFKALCPFHSEKTPSFIVSPERQSFHCFGCGKGGSVFDWVMEYEHVDFREALETLAEKAGVKLTQSFDDTPQNKLKARILEANHLASEYYQYLLFTHPLGEKARIYLKNRGISDATAKTFGLGYSPNSWDGLRKFLTKKGYTEDLLETAGLLIKSARGGYDRFRGRVMFTLRDHRSSVVGFSGRVLDPDIKEAKYINTSETPVYIKGNMLYGLDVSKSSILKTGSAILMEGEFDVISSFQEGISNAVAIKGSALTEGHINLLKRFTSSLIFALDADFAGDAAARRGIELAERAGFDLKVVSIPQGKDPDEAVRENPVMFKKAISEAVPIYDYFIQSALTRYDRMDPYGKKKISDEILPFVDRIENPVIQAHYLKKIAEILDVSEQVVDNSMRKMKKTYQKTENSKPEVENNTYTPRQKLELYVLAFILQTNTFQYLEEMGEQIPSEDLSLQSVQSILSSLKTYVVHDKPFFIKDFADTLPKELLPVLDRAYLWDLSDTMTSDELVAREWQKILRELKRTIVKDKIKQASLKNQSEAGPEVSVLTAQLRDLDKSTTI